MYFALIASLFLPLLILYLYLSLLLWVGGRVLNAGSRWIAWVPVANLYYKRRLRANWPTLAVIAGFAGWLRVSALFVILLAPLAALPWQIQQIAFHKAVRDLADSRKEVRQMALLKLQRSSFSQEKIAPAVPLVAASLRLEHEHRGQRKPGQVVNNESWSHESFLAQYARETAIFELAHDRSDDVRASAARIVATVAKSDARLANRMHTLIAALLNDPSPKVRGIAAAYVVENKVVEIDAVPALIASLKDPAWANPAIKLLLQIARQDASRLKAVLPALADGFVAADRRLGTPYSGSLRYSDERYAYFEVFGVLRDDAIPILLMLVESASPVARAEAARSLAFKCHCHPHLREELVPMLTAWLKHESLDLRSAAAVALGLIGRPAASAVPVLESMQANTDRQVESDVRTALLRIRNQNVYYVECADGRKVRAGMSR